MAPNESKSSAPTAVELILSAKHVVPVVPRNAIYNYYSVVVDQGRIIDLLPTSKALEMYISVRHVELKHHILMPGLINSHTHAAMNLFRGLSDDDVLCDWLQYHIQPAEAKYVSPEFVKVGVEHAIAEMIRSGTTCFNDMYYFPQDSAEVVEQCHMRAMLGQVILEYPSAYGSNSKEYFEFAQRNMVSLQAKKNDLGLVRYSIAPHAPYTVSDDSFEKVEMFSRKHGIPIHMHLHETEAECNDSERQVQGSFSCHISSVKVRPLQNLKRLGLLSNRLIAVHMTQLTDEDIQEVAKARVNVVHCPSSNFKLSSGICRVTSLIDHNVNVAIGTDGASSNNTLDMMAEIKLAAIVAKVNSKSCTSVSAAIALEMATINGAKALGMETELGSIEVGKFADLVAVSCDSIEMLPMYNPISHLVYVAGRER